MVPSLGTAAAMVILGMALPEVHQQYVGCDPVTEIPDEVIAAAQEVVAAALLADAEWNGTRKRDGRSWGSVPADQVRRLIAAAVAAERERIVTLLKRAADGRREYAGPDDGSEARPLLLSSAEGYEAAALLIEDPKRLLDVIPAWRWTAEEHASIRMEAP